MPRKDNTQDGAGDRGDRQEPAGTHQEMAPGMAALLQAMQQQAAQQQQHQEEQLALQRQHQAEMMQMMAGFFSGRGSTRSNLSPEPRQQDGPHHEASEVGGSDERVWGEALVRESTEQESENTFPDEAHVGDIGAGARRERRGARGITQDWGRPVNENRQGEGPPELRDTLDVLRRHPGPPRYQRQRTEVSTQRNHTRLPEYGPIQGSLSGHRTPRDSMPLLGSHEGEPPPDNSFHDGQMSAQSLDAGRGSAHFQGWSQRADHGRGRPNWPDPPRPKMATFRGSEKEDWDAFFSGFERLARRHQWTTIQRLDWMHESLRESAAQFMARLPHAVKEDYACLCDELRGRYGWREPASTTRQRLDDLKQGSNSLVEHAEEVRKLVTRAYPDVDPQMQDQYAAEAFARGLRNRRIAFLVLQQAPVSLAQATTFADTCEHNYRATMHEDKPRARSRRVSWAEDEDGWSSGGEGGSVRRMEPSQQLLASGQQGRGPSYNAEKPQAREAEVDARLTQLDSKLTQLSAQLAAALQRGTPVSRYRSPSPAPRGEKLPRRRPKGPCYACGEEGHLQRECSRSPSPARSTGEDSGNE